MRTATFRFYEELNDFLPKNRRKRPFYYVLKFNQSVKDAIESLGVPHAEVDLIMVNSESVGFNYQLHDGDMVSVYPVFETLDISPIIKLRPEPLRYPGFVLDVHLGKLCKYMRMLGFDTIYRNNLEDAEIINIAIEQKRIILTRDIGILKNRLVSHGYWVRSQHPREQLLEVIQRFDLSCSIKPFYRCTVCNGVVEKVDKESISQLLESGTKKYFTDFFRCSACKKIYWKGSHYEKMKDFVSGIFKKNI